MYARKVRRKCSIRGCRCTESFAISKTREIGNSVIICKNCLKEGIIAIDEIKPNEKSNIPKSNPANIPSLFFNAQTTREKTNEDAETIPQSLPSANPAPFTQESQDEQPTLNDEETEDAEQEQDTGFKCPDCGKVFDSERGLKSHQRYCDGKK